MSGRVAQRALFGAQLSKESAGGPGVGVDADFDERGVVAVSSGIRKSVRSCGSGSGAQQPFEAATWPWTTP